MNVSGTTVGIVIGIFGIIATFLTWLYSEKGHAVRAWFACKGKEIPLQTYSVIEQSDDSNLNNIQIPISESKNAYDLVNLGEHLCYLSNSKGKPLDDIRKSITYFTTLLTKYALNSTRVASKAIEDATARELQSQISIIRSSLEREATPTQLNFIKLGEILRLLSFAKSATRYELASRISTFLHRLDECRLSERIATDPLKDCQWKYYENISFKRYCKWLLKELYFSYRADSEWVAELASLMKPIHLQIQHETLSIEIE